MIKLILVSCFSVFLFLLSCDTNEPLPEGALGLTLEDVSCTEAWITLTTGNLPSTSYIKITNNSNLLETIDVTSTKTLRYYDSLKPNTTYEFQAFSSLRGEDVIGNKLRVTTLDTTSHNFTWQTFSFGQHSSSVLYDVAIIDENIAHYNGSSWTKIKSGTTTNINDAWGVFENGTGTVYCPVTSIFNPPQDKKILKIISNKVDSISWEMDRIVYCYWTKNKNFLYVGGEGVYVNKLCTWEQSTLPAITTNSIRGNDINDIFAVGSLGTIFHFNGISWQVISSYTSKENYRVTIKNNIVAICG